MPGEINLFVSNGTCYMAPKEQADEAMIPCGNAANEHAACCQKGDNCLESSVCFNGDFGVTYVSGCTDPAYEHPSCPDKFLYQMVPATPWLGLSYCNGTSDEWVLCDQAQHPITLAEPDPCWCPKDEDDRTATLSQSSSIPWTASLPTKILGSIQFAVGHYPTLNPALETTATTESPVATDGSSSTLPSSSPAPTAESTGDEPTAPPNTENETGLSTSAKTGAIAGGAAGAFVLVLLLLLGFLCFRHRQKKKYLQREEERRVENFMNEGVINKGGSATDPDPLISLGIGIAHGGEGRGGGDGIGGVSPSSSSPDTPALSELDSRAARPWSIRSELENNNNYASTRSSFHSASSHGDGGQARRAPSELAAHPIAELP